MLAPGEMLLKPREEPAQPPAQPPAERAGPQVPTATDDDDHPSFLLILLRALGAIHT